MAGSIGSGNVDGGGMRQQSSSSNGTRRKGKISFPMTSMIDVTFLLLSYFLMTTVFRQAEGQLAGTLPGPRSIDPIEVIPLQVRAIGADCESAVYSLDGENELLRSPRELVDSLRKRRKRTGRNAILFIQAGRAVRWRYVVEACNQAASADFQATIRI